MSSEFKKNPTWKVLGFLFLLLVVPVIWVMLNKTGKHYSRKLPILFDIEITPKGDTIFHTINDFKLVNQNGDSTTLKSIGNHIYLANFFFSTCQTACPKMNGFIAQHIYTEFEKDTAIRFLSFSVDPTNDSPAVLKQYASSLNVKFPQWQFLTGNKKTIYNLAEFSFKIPGADAGHQGLFHSEQIVLVDRLRRVRGVFETGGQNDKKEIIDAVRALKLEYNNENNTKKR